MAMAAEKTWFLAPDFTFWPDGEFGIGSVIEHPLDPTAVLASLLLHRPPKVTLPPVRTHSEPRHNHTAARKRTFNINMFTSAASFLSGNINIDQTRLRTKSFGPVDLEVTSFNGSFSADSIREITSIPEVNKHVRSSIYFKKRPVYVITAIAVAKDSFHVSKEFVAGHSVSLGASGTIPTGAIPVEAGATIGGGEENTQTDESYAEAGVIVGFRCHVIQPKGRSEVKTKLFVSKQAFFTGSVPDLRDTPEEELEFCSVTGDVLHTDLDEKASFVKQEVDGETWIAFQGDDKM